MSSCQNSKSQKKKMNKLIATLDQLEAASSRFRRADCRNRSAGRLDPRAKDTAIAQITSSVEYHQVQIALEQIDSALDEMGLDRQTVRTTAAALDQSITGMEDAMVYLEDTQEELSAGKITLEDAISQMNEKKPVPNGKFTAHWSKILVGETSLDSAQQQLDDARLEAKKNRYGRYADNGYGFQNPDSAELFHACWIHN